MEHARLSFNDLFVGFKSEIHKKISQGDIVAFAQLTGDKHPLHTNKEYARDHGFDDVIAHGFLISSYISTLIGMKLPGEKVIILSQHATYLKPVYPGDELTIAGEITALDRRFSTATIEVSIVARNNRKVCKGGVQVKLRD